MKKTLTIAILFVAIIMLATMGVNAATSATLADELYSKLSAYGLTSADKVKIERYLADNNVTDEQANTILAKADEGIAIMKDNGVKDVKKLSKESQNELKSIANEAATTVGLTLNFSSNGVKVYNAEGKLIETITSTDGKLAYTGNSVNTVLVVASIAVIALAATVVTKKTLSKVGARAL